MPRSPSITDPPLYSFEITPDNDADLEREINMISFSSAGSIAYLNPDGEEGEVVDGSLAAGVQHVLRATRILATGTTATGITGYSWAPAAS